MNVINTALAIQSRAYWQSSRIANSDQAEPIRIDAEKTLGQIAAYSPSANLRDASQNCLLAVNQ